MISRLSPRVFRWLLNLWPCFRGTGGQVTHISSDWRVWEVELPLSLRTRNYVGTIFGGSLYGALDPMYMIMLIHILGPDFIVWDKAGSVRFLKPGRSRLHATCRIDEAEVQEIRRLLRATPKVDRTYTAILADAQGTPHAEIQKVVQIRRGAGWTEES